MKFIIGGICLIIGGCVGFIASALMSTSGNEERCRGCKGDK